MVKERRPGWEDDENFLDFVTIKDAEGNVVHLGDGLLEEDLGEATGELFDPEQWYHPDRVPPLPPVDENAQDEEQGPNG